MSVTPFHGRAGRMNRAGKLLSYLGDKASDLGIIGLSCGSLFLAGCASEVRSGNDYGPGTEGTIQSSAMGSAVDRGTTYVVKPGDTLYGIAQRNGVALTELQQLNGTQLVRVGQIIYLPAPPPEAMAVNDRMGAGAANSAQAEYDAALAGYQQALKKADQASSVGSLTDMNWLMQQGAAPGTQKGLAFLSMLAGSAQKQDATSDVEVARQRLSAARAKLEAVQLAPPPTPQIIQVAEIHKGTVNIGSDPEGADVFVDGSFLGNTPCRLSLPAGEHNIEIKARDGRDYSRNLTVLAECDLTFRADFGHQ